MTRLDSARATVGRTRDSLSPYASSARQTARHYAGEAKQRLAPTMNAATAQAAHTARRQYDRHLAPQLEHAFAALPPKAQAGTMKAAHRAQEAALAAKLSATAMVPKVTDAVEGARAGVRPVAHEAQARTAAALTALHGNVSAAEISELAAKNAKKQQRGGRATSLAVAGTLCIGAGALAWQWWRRQSNPEWLVEPPTSAPLSTPVTTEQSAAEQSDPKADPKPGQPHAKADDDRPKPHDPRKPH